MTATYEVTVKLTIVHDVDKVDETLKDANELATDICNMICDEAALCGGVAMYEVIETSINVK